MPKSLQMAFLYQVTNLIRSMLLQWILGPDRALRTHLLFSCEAVAADDLPHLLLLLDLWVALHHVLQRRQVQLQLLCQMLQIDDTMQVY